MEDHGSQEGSKGQQGKKTVKLPFTHHSSQFEEIRIHHSRKGEEVDGYKCLICKEPFLSRNKTAIKRHLEKKHRSVWEELEGMLF